MWDTEVENLKQQLAAAEKRAEQYRGTIESLQASLKEVYQAINAYFDGTIKNLECFCGHPDASTLLSKWEDHCAALKAAKEETSK